jgi:hypothetical protein
LYVSCLPSVSEVERLSYYRPVFNAFSEEKQRLLRPPLPFPLHRPNPECMLEHCSKYLINNVLNWLALFSRNA